MANQDFDINIRVNANTAQIDAIRNSFEKLGAQVKVTNAQAEAGGGGGFGRASVFGVSAVAVGLSLQKVIADIGEEQVRITEQFGKQLEHLTNLSAKWAETAASAKSQDDVEKLALSTLVELEAAQKRMTDYQNAGLGFTKQWADTILGVVQLMGGPRLSGLFEGMFKAQADSLTKQVVLTKQAAVSAADLAIEYKEEFDEEKLKPFEEGVASITAKIQEAERAQAEAGTKNIERYTEQGKKVQQYTAQLNELIKAHEKEQSESQATADERAKDVDFVQKQVQRASPTARAILMNEQAAQLARDQGRGRDADMFERTVQQLKGSATPQQQLETAVLEKLIEQNGLLREIRDSWK